jgi:hypothetical protein
MRGKREHGAQRAHPHADTWNRSVRVVVDDDDRAQLLPFVRWASYSRKSREPTL